MFQLSSCLAWIELNKSFNLFLRPFKHPALVVLMYFSKSVICNKVKLNAREHGELDCLYKGQNFGLPQIFILHTCGNLMHSFKVQTYKLMHNKCMGLCGNLTEILPQLILLLLHPQAGYKLPVD